MPTERINNAVQDIIDVANGLNADEDVCREDEANKMLNVTISTILLLASGNTAIPAQYYVCSELFLQSIRASQTQTNVCFNRNITCRCVIVERTRRTSDKRAKPAQLHAIRSKSPYAALGRRSARRTQTDQAQPHSSADVNLI